jgi:MFS family permease
MSKRETIKLYLNLGHTFDHLLMLIFPTVVLAISLEWQRSYSELLPLALPGFIAFGVFSIPAGWLADHWSRSGMMTLFFFGIGAASIVTGLAQTEWQLSAGLGLVGLFAAIYHPVGIAMLVADEPQVGRTLGVNGVYGNTGLALAALIAGALADLWHWRAAFFVPGIVCMLTGIGFALAARGGDPVRVKAKAGAARLPRSVLVRVFTVVVVATICGGIIFNATTVSMPKVFDERLSALTQSTMGIGVLVCIVYLIAAMAQLLVGTWLDKKSLKAVFVPVVALQVPLLLAAGSLQGYAMLACAVAMMFFVFGQIPINDAMIARYTSDEWRARAYGVRYVLSFAASAAAVPLIAGVYKATGDFTMLFNILAVLAACVLLAALAFPSSRETSSATA